MHSLMLLPIEKKHSNLHKTASCAQRYTRELKIEMQPLLNKLFTTYPKEAGRFIGLLNEIDLMTSATFEKSELVLIQERYPDFSNLLDCKHKEGKAPYIASVYLALPYLMFGRGSVDVLPSEDSRSVLFAMDALTSEIYGEPILIAMAMEKDIHKLSQSLRDQIMGID